jgi:hypothetical protein
LALLFAILLVATVFIRPQEFVPGLDKIPLLYLLTIFAILGIVIEIVRGRIRVLGSPQYPYLLAFTGWCVLVTVKAVGFSTAAELRNSLLFSIVFMLVVLYAGRIYANFRALAVTLVAISIALSAMSIYQSTEEYQCIDLTLDEAGERTSDVSAGQPTGIPCEDLHECERKERQKNPDSRREFVCEKWGLFGSFTVAHGRVRWRGTLADPNELAMAVAAAVSFCFAFHAAMKRKSRHLILAALLGIATYCVILTGSRGGVLILLVIFGVYFVRRYGARGFVVGALAGMPVLLLGGRSGEDAEASSIERLELLYEGIDLFKSRPIFGLGCGQFVENCFMTAHNSYLLAAAELGFPGMILWSLLVYVSVKIPFVLATRKIPGLDPRLAALGLALTTSFAGIFVGIFFLSFVYHNMLFIYFGMAGALYGVAKQSIPWFEVKVTRREVLWVVLGDALVVAAIYAYTRLRPPV